jgi:hypothetical protein
MPLSGVLGLAKDVIGGTPRALSVGVVEHREDLPIVSGRIEFAAILRDEAISVLRRQANSELRFFRGNSIFGGWECHVKLPPNG